MKHIPNLFTLLNLVFGCLAIVFLLQNGIGVYGDGEGATWIDLSEKMWLASLFIALAAVVDYLDGFVARLFKATSEMGKQLDSLADLVTFGVAPGMILYQFLRMSLAAGSGSLDASAAWLLPAFALPCGAAWRLARFNIDPGQSFSFKGLPVPAVGLFFATLPMMYWQADMDWVRSLLLNQWFLYFLAVLFTWLMVSTLPLMAFKFQGYGWKENRYKYLLLLLSVPVILLMKWLSAPVVLVLYITLSLVQGKKTAAA